MKYLTPDQGFTDVLVQVSCGGAHTLVLDNLGNLRVMGCGTYGALGKGDTAQSDTPKLIEINMSDMTNPNTPRSNPSTPKGTKLEGKEATRVHLMAVAAGQNHSIGLARDGRL